MLLINLTKDAGALSSLGALRVTHDGNKVSEASSLSQTSSGTSTSPPSYLASLTSRGVQPLVFVPHFSSHLIQLLAHRITGCILGTSATVACRHRCCGCSLSSRLCEEKEVRASRTPLAPHQLFLTHAPISRLSHPGEISRAAVASERRLF